MKVQRNAPCPCGSGKKHKHCCLGKEARRGIPGWQKAVFVGVGLLMAGVLVAAVLSFVNKPADESRGRVWSEEHGHWHDL